MHLGDNTVFKTSFGDKPNFQNFIWGSTPFKISFVGQPNFQNLMWESIPWMFLQTDDFLATAGCLRHMMISPEQIPMRRSKPMVMRRYLGLCLLYVFAIDLGTTPRKNVKDSQHITTQIVALQNTERRSGGSIQKSTAIHPRKSPMCIPILESLQSMLLTRLWMRTS